MVKKPLQIVVLGSDEGICTDEQYRMAEEVGEEIARNDCITVTGGGAGVMEAALKGARSEGGMTVGIIPERDLDDVNDFADVGIATGIGLARDEMNVFSAHGVILVGGGAGTLNEATFAYMAEKPVVALKPSGGTAGKVAGKYLDQRNTMKIMSAQEPKEAVDMILEEIKKREGLDS